MRSPRFVRILKEILHPQKWLLLSKKDSWVRPYLRIYRGPLLFVLAMGVLTFASGSALMFTSGYLISKAATKPYNILLIYVPIVLTRAFGIARPSFRYVERLTGHNWVLKMTSSIRLKLYRSLEILAGSHKATKGVRSGDILGILTEDIEHIQNLYLRTIFPTLISWLLCVVVTIALGFFSIPFAFSMFVSIIALVVVAPLVAILVNKATVYRRKAKRHRLYSELTDSVLGIGDWQYSGRAQEYLQGYQVAEAEARKEEKWLQTSMRYMNFAIQFKLGLIVVAVLVWASRYFAGTGTAGLNWVAAFALAFFPLTDAFGSIAQGVMEVPLYEDTVERLHELPEPSLAEDQRTDEDVAQRTNHETGIAARPLQDYGIRLENVLFHYERRPRPVLSDFDFSVSQGEVVAVLGRSGTGKTTLTKLIRGELVPQHGIVTIGGKGAAEVAETQQGVFAVLDQSPHLFDTSIWNNVRLGNLDATDQEVETALGYAGLRPLIDRLPEGAHTLVEESGKRFSGGERQRIALARIFLQNAPIVILDEPAIGLDPVTERALLDTIFAVLEGKTILWVTHHLAGIEHVDRVVFLAEGNIEMEGAPRELLRENPHFQHLYELDAVQ